MALDVRTTSQVGGTGLRPGSGHDDDKQEVRGDRRGESVVQDKDSTTLSLELSDWVGDELGDELEAELGREDRRLENDEEVIKMELSTDVEGDPQDLDDVQSRKDEIEMLAREMEEQEMQDPGEILRHLQENLGEHEGERGPNHDPTQQYGALVLMEQMFRDEGNEAMANAVAGAAARLLSERGMEINKGMIVSEAAALYSSEKVGSVSDLRSLYMEQVVGHKGITSSFNGIMEKYGEQGFVEAVKFLLRAAGDDLNTMKSDTDRLQQKEVLDNLYQLEVLNTMRERTNDVLEQVGRSYPVAPEINSQKVMGRTFEMLEHQIRINESTVSQIARDTVPDSIEGRIAFLREYRGLVSMIPLKVLDGLEQGSSGGLRLRERLNDVIMEAQDVVDAEEQEKLNQQ
jgi:type III secretion system YopN/LcrE/InvE/MxiC family regulator